MSEIKKRFKIGEKVLWDFYHKEVKIIAYCLRDKTFQEKIMYLIEYEEYKGKFLSINNKKVHKQKWVLEQELSRIITKE